jgi:hypothetical protein
MVVTSRGVKKQKFLPSLNPFRKLQKVQLNKLFTKTFTITKKVKTPFLFTFWLLTFSVKLSSDFSTYLTQHKLCMLNKKMLPFLALFVSFEAECA